MVFNFLKTWFNDRGEIFQNGQIAETKVNREEKKELISELKDVFAGSELVVVTHYVGITVAEVSELRKKIREAGASFRVTKNRITRLALEGTDYASLADMMTGPTAIAASKDPVAAAKAVVEFAKKNDKLVILGAVMNGKLLSAADVKALADLPSLDEIRAQLIALIQTPATRIARISSEPAAQLARVFGAYAKKEQAA